MIYRGHDPETLVDRAAASASLPESEIQAFLGSQRVFISSHMISLKDERRHVADAITEMGAIPVWFEKFGGRDADPEDAYLSEVAASNVYVGILGEIYGRQLRNRFSATHAEYVAAEENGLRLSVWTHVDEGWGGRQQEFVDEVRNFHVVGTYSSPEDLALGVAGRLREIAADELSPWVKLAHLVFRAKEIRKTSSEVTVTAEVRDGGVNSALRVMGGEVWNRPDVRFTDPHDSFTVQVDEVKTSTRSSQTVEFELHMKKISDRGGLPVEFTFQNFTPNDLTELSLREHLFGERNPAAEAYVSLPSPLAHFPASLPEGALRPILRLFLTESLVGSGRSARIKQLRLGVDIGGRRKLILEWAGSPLQSSPPEERRIEGEIQL